MQAYSSRINELTTPLSGLDPSWAAYQFLSNPECQEAFHRAVDTRVARWAITIVDRSEDKTSAIVELDPTKIPTDTPPLPMHQKILDEEDPNDERFYTDGKWGEYPLTISASERESLKASWTIVWTEVVTRLSERKQRLVNIPKNIQEELTRKLARKLPGQEVIMQMQQGGYLVPWWFEAVSVNPNYEQADGTTVGLFFNIPDYDGKTVVRRIGPKHWLLQTDPTCELWNKLFETLDAYTVWTTDKEYLANVLDVSREWKWARGIDVLKHFSEKDQWLLATLFAMNHWLDISQVKPVAGNKEASLDFQRDLLVYDGIESIVSISDEWMHARVVVWWQEETLSWYRHSDIDDKNDPWFEDQWHGWEYYIKWQRQIVDN